MSNLKGWRHTLTILIFALVGCSVPDTKQEVSSSAQAPTSAMAMGAMMLVSPHIDNASQGAVLSGIATPVSIASTSDKYAGINANLVQQTSVTPVSTFSLDVDTGSYSNVRRFLKEGQLPTKDAVRVEELINYFRYDYPAPKDNDTPFALGTELAPTPWNPDTLLLRIAVRAVQPIGKRPPANLVFLLDTSGSMSSPDRLPLLRTAMRMLVRQLTAADRVAIVTYAGTSGIALPSTPGDRTGEILAAIDNLVAEGSTNGGAGIANAYEVAAQNLKPGAINRVLLGTDGDFNVGITDTKELISLIARQRQRGIALTTLGFGRGDLNEQLMEQLADAGDGNYAYIDSAQEASKVLAQQVDATLFTVAKDVKVQVEFNPMRVAEYRLIGYENRLLQREDFSNDRVDAGEVGAGHTVTAFYEITPTTSTGRRIEPLRYQPEQRQSVSQVNAEWAFLRLRYKKPDGGSSLLLELPIVQQPNHNPDADFRFAAAVAAFGQLLRGGNYTGNFGWNDLIALARGSRGEDLHGERAEFVALAELAKNLSLLGQ